MTTDTTVKSTSRQAGSTLIETLGVLGVMMVLLVGVIAGIGAAWKIMRESVFASDIWDIAKRIQSGYANDGGYGNFTATTVPTRTLSVADAFSIGALDSKYCPDEASCLETGTNSRAMAAGGIEISFAPARTPDMPPTAPDNAFSITVFNASRSLCVKLITHTVRPSTGFLGWRVNEGDNIPDVPADFMDPSISPEWPLIEANEQCTDGFNTVTGFWR